MPGNSNGCGNWPQQCGVSPEELVQDNLRKWLADERTMFLSAANLILKKNAELYRRLP